MNIRITVVNGIILVKKKIYLFQKLRKEVFCQYYNIKTVKYQRNKGTLKRIKRIYYFPKIKKFVENNMRKCDTC
jgi:hypothetical protein